jgi:hypothetical protein
MSALAAHIKAANDETRAWIAEDPDNRSAFLLVEEAKFWADQGIVTVAQFEHSSAVSAHGDTYKELHGIRPRWINYGALSTDEIWKMCEDLHEDARQMEAAERLEDERREAEAAAEQKILDATREEPESLTHNPFADFFSN